MFKLKKKSKKKILNFGYLNKKNLKDIKKKNPVYLKNIITVGYEFYIER